MRNFIISAVLAIALAPISSAADTKGGPKKDTLKYAPTYAAALIAAKDRNTLIFATFHKDH